VKSIALAQLRGADVLTHSRMACYKQCARKHFYRYELGVRRDVSAQPLRMGTAVHVGLDLAARGLSVTEAIASALHGYDGPVPSWVRTPEHEHEWAVEREIVGRLLAGYFWFWSRDGVPDYARYVEVLQTEGAFRLPIRNPDTGKATTSFRLGGKRDKIVRLGDGRVAVMEHKTTGDPIAPESDYWRRLRIDEQISLYLTSAQDEGIEAVTVLYDVIHKPDISPRQVPEADADGFKIVVDANGERVYLLDKHGNPTKPRQSGDADKGWTLLSRVESADAFGLRLEADIMERPTHYYARQEIPRLDADLTEFRQDLWQQQQAIRDAQRLGRWFRTTGACLTMGRCEYLDICHQGIDLDRGIPDGFVRVDDIHPELATEGE